MNRSLFARTARRVQIGVSVVEAMIVLAVIGCSLSTTLPSFNGALERRHLDGAAAQLETDLQYLRSSAVAQNRTLRLRVQSDAAGSCYVVHSGPANACTCAADGSARCTASAEALRSVGFLNDSGVQLQSNSASIVFEPLRGTITPTATLRLNARERSVHLVVNLMGRVRSCTPSSGMPGYTAC